MNFYIYLILLKIIVKDIFCKRNNFYSVLDETLKVSNFRSFDDLLNSSLTISVQEIRAVYICTSKIIVLRNFNLDFLRNCITSDKSIEIYFSNLKGINIKRNELIAKNSINLVFSYTKLVFYHDGNIIKWCCNNSFTNSFFKKIYDLKFTFSVKFYLNTCPLIFENSIINRIQFFGLSNSFVKQNEPTFEKLDRKFNSTVNSLLISSYRFRLTSDFLDSNVFKQLNVISFKGVIDSIDVNTFKNLSQIKEISFETESMNIIQNSQFKWLKYLIENNINVKLDFIFVRNVDFYEQDFCLYHKIPSYGEFYISYTFYHVNCTCTQLMLLNSSKNILKNKTCLNYFSNKCNFSNLTKACGKNPMPIEFKYSKLDFYFITEYLNLYSISSKLVFSIIGFLTNLISIRICYLIEKKNLIHSLVMINSILNTILCAFSILHLFGECVFYTGIYCSTFQRSVFVQYYEIFIYNFLYRAIL
ncbi:unnamed protein product [Brachionus calyciflorus]|uniref:Uncharacterized protein n=1 Tax=Brachionus calyciflorus TaxID=104777 RepID=A0A813PWH3_9BILA|nr:unnamed protein product [Brachionus calyciflorus]